jgi:6-methylsalicylic acid synthase
VPGDHTLSIGWVPQASAADVPACWELAAEHGAAGAVILASGPAGTEPAETVPLLRDVAEQDRRDAETAEPEGSDSLSGLSPQEIQAHLVEHVSTQIAAEMRLPVTDLDPRRSLVEQGLDSVMTMMVRRRLEKRFGHSLPTTLLWQKPTVASIAEYLTELLVEAAEATPEQEERDVPLVVG